MFLKFLFLFSSVVSLRRPKSAPLKRFAPLNQPGFCAPQRCPSPCPGGKAKHLVDLARTALNPVFLTPLDRVPEPGASRVWLRSLLGLATGLLTLGAPLAATASPRDSLGTALDDPTLATSALSPAIAFSPEASGPLSTGSSLGRQLEPPAQGLALLDYDAPGQGAFPVATPPAVPASYPITPARRALLNTIRYAEGTWAGGQDIGYRILFGGSLMGSMERHPNLVIRTARYASAAAGAYQFMPFTWSMASRLLGLQRFSPGEQDQAALLLIQRRGALPLADGGRFTPKLAAQLAPEWASFPTLGGGSYYGQPVRRFAELKRFYEENLAQLQAEVPSDARRDDLAGAPVCLRGRLVCQFTETAKPSL